MGNHTSVPGLRPARAQAGGRLRLLVFLGTRPEAVKLAPVIIAAQAAHDVELRIVSSGQHPRSMLEVFEEFRIDPDVDLDLYRRGQTLTDVLRAAVGGCADEIARWSPDVVLVQGDTTSALAGALAAFYAGVPVGHLEAGLRTENLRQPYPEEMNRRVIDTFADHLFPPTPASAGNVAAELMRGADVFVTGNTVVDAALEILRRPRMLLPGSFGEAWSNGFRRRVLVTMHRRESWGDPMDHIVSGVARAAERFQRDAFFVPLHPNPIVRRSFIRELPPNVLVGDPLPYGPFVRMLAGCDLVVTDSGGILEEATCLGKRVLILRETTERPEALGTGLATIVGVNSRTIDAAITSILGNEHVSDRPCAVFGDGRGGARTVGWLLWRYGLRARPPLPFEPEPPDPQDADATRRTPAPYRSGHARPLRTVRPSPMRSGADQ